MYLPQNNKGGDGKELGYRRHKIGHEVKMFKAGYMVVHNIILSTYVYVSNFPLKNFLNDPLSTYIPQKVNRGYSLHFKKIHI